MSDVPLTVGIRSNLISLKQTARLTDRTTGRLSTGKKVASAVDNPTNYFAAINYNDRANALTGRLDGMGEAIQQVKAADNGITSVRGFLTQMKGVVNDALANSDSDARKELGKQFNELIVQVRDLAKDSGYAGINLLYDNKSRTVQFNEKIGESTLDIVGFNISGAGEIDETSGEVDQSTVTGGDYTGYALSFDVGNGVTTDVVGIKSHGVNNTYATEHEVNWGGTDYLTSLEQVVGQIEKMEDKLKVQASKLANNLAVITQREDFTEKHISILQEGADKLTLADLNEEGANLLALQTAGQLGVQSLSLASQQSQQVLRIIG